MMKTIISILIAFLWVSNIQAQTLNIANSFKCDAAIFEGMYLEKFPENVQREGIVENPGHSSQSNVFNYILPSDINNGVKAVYYEIYTNDDGDYAGVIVVEYNNEAALKKILPRIIATEKTATLTLNSYLIIPNGRWKNSAERIDAMVQYYQQKLGATLFIDRKKNVQKTEATPTEKNVRKVENRTDYEKLSPKEIQYFFSKATPKHKLGSVTKYSYDSIQKIDKQTSYEAKDGKLVFEYERTFQYDNKDSLIYETQYSEIPSDAHTEYITEHYQYNFQDSFTLNVRSINGRVQDSIFTYYKKDAQQRVLIAYMTQRSIRDGVSYTRRMEETQYQYNDKGLLLSKIKIENNGDVSDEWRYEYDAKGQLKKSVYRNVQSEYTVSETYNTKGQLILAEEKRMSASNDTRRYQYNAKGLEIIQNKYNSSKLVYQYSTTYDAKNRKTKYVMTDKTDNSSGIWLYEYDNKNRLKYKIDLFWKEEKPAPKTEAVEAMPGPVEVPPTKATD